MILVINSGSSSIKCALFDEGLHREWSRHFEKGSLQEELRKVPAPAIVSHRIVHGGSFQKAQRINEGVKQQIRRYAELAPLHNKADLAGIDLAEKLFPKATQVAVFDTAFHHTLPLEAKVYPGPYRWFEEGIQRFGFHGISFQYCASLIRVPKLLICHLGSGASLCAVKGGQSIDTTMGYTPLEGLMMDTRSGTIDPGILLHLLKTRQPAELTDELYRKSGLLGISGLSDDMRQILAHQHQPKVALALNLYIHRLTSCMGSMISSLQGVDAIVFTGGIGENAPLIRKRACEAFAFLGLELDNEKNEHPPQEDCALSSSHSKIKVFLIHTQEELQIAKETREFT